MDVHEDTPKLDAEYIVLLKLKRLGRVRYSRYKVQVGGYDLIYLPLKDAWMYKYTLTLDTNEKAWAQQTGLEVVDKSSKDRHMEDHIDVPEEEALTPEDSLTRLYTLEEVRGLDQEVKRHGLYSNE